MDRLRCLSVLHLRIFCNLLHFHTLHFTSFQFDGSVLCVFVWLYGQIASIEFNREHTRTPTHIQIMQPGAKNATNHSNVNSLQTKSICITKVHLQRVFGWYLCRTDWMAKAKWSKSKQRNNIILFGSLVSIFENGCLLLLSKCWKFAIDLGLQYARDGDNKDSTKLILYAVGI